MEAIILAGGFGTRLSDIVSDVPKPMASVNSQPFLKYIFNYLLENGVKHVILAIGYKAETIQEFFGDFYQDIKVTYSIEGTPLGTGGAIKKALECCKDEEVFIVNGDTYFDVNLKEMKNFHREKKSYLTVAIKSMSDFDRYGSVIVKDNKIVQFVEKKKTIQGKINGGTYLLNQKIFDSMKRDFFSFEKVILENGGYEIYAFESNGYFIDIGIPEDYYKAQKYFSDMPNCLKWKEGGVDK